VDDPKALWRQIAKAGLAATFAAAGGIIGGPLAGAAAVGLGAPAGGLAAGAAAGAGAGALGGAFGSAVGSGGDPDAIWRAALAGGATGGLGGAIGPTTGVLSGAGKGAATGVAGNLVNQGLSGNDFDWAALAAALGTGAAGGAAAGAAQGAFPGSDVLAKFWTGLAGSTFKGLGQDPLAGANAQLDQSALDNEKARQDAMQRAQEEWKRKFAEASAAQQAEMLAAQREWQSRMEAHRAEYEAKLQAFLAERETQIAEALRAMGVGEGGIGSILADRQKQMETQRAEEASQRAALIESRQFFPSELLSESGPLQDFAQSSVLVPHSPPPIQFGAEGLPASFAHYGGQPTPEFSAEGFLPSGATGDGVSPPSVSPMTPTRRRWVPSLLGGLARQPYLRMA
jgi:hypothetical protein